MKNVYLHHGKLPDGMWTKFDEIGVIPIEVAEGNMTGFHEVWSEAEARQRSGLEPLKGASK